MADCKLISAANIAAILDNGGHFLAPAPMYECFAKHFEAAVADHDREILLPHKRRFNRGFEVPLVVRHLKKDYRLRMIIIFDQAVAQTKRQNLKRRVEQTREALEALRGTLNGRKPKTEEQIQKACDAILATYGTANFFTYRIDYQALVTYKYKNRGRPSAGKPAEKVAVHSDLFDIQVHFDEATFSAALDRCGYYPLLTDVEAENLSLQQAMAHHKASTETSIPSGAPKGPTIWNRSICSAQSASRRICSCSKSPCRSLCWSREPLGSTSNSATVGWMASCQTAKMCATPKPNTCWPPSSMSSKARCLARAAPLAALSRN